MGLGLTSSIHIASTGMRAAEKTINVSGDNLANANTIGYKAERADFTSFLPYLYSYGYGPQDWGAGTNPRTIGQGVELASVTTDFSQGSFKEGMTNSDIAINGNGFFIVKQPNDAFNVPYYTRNGVLKVNGDGTLTTNNGLYVMGYNVDDQFRIQKDQLRTISIPIGQKTIAIETNSVELAGQLNAVGESSTEGTVLRTKPMTDLSKSSPGDQKLSAAQIPLPQVEGKTHANGTASGGDVETGKYLYRLSYVDADGVESDFSAPIEVSVSAGQDSVTLTNLPDLENGYTQLRIYRAVNPQDESITPSFYQVADIDPATTANNYTDTKSTTEITDPTKKLNLSRLEGTYQYYVTYVDAGGNESRPSLISDSVSVNGGKLGGQLELSDIPTIDAGNSDGWVGRKIYRSTGKEATNFYLVGEIPNFDADATLIDRMADVDLIKQPEMNFAGGGNTLINTNTKLIDVGQQDQSSGSFVHAFETGTLVFDPTKGETSLRQATLKIDETTTVGDYLKFLNEAYGIRTTADGVPADQGKIGSVINNGSPGASIIDGALFITGNAGKPNTLELLSSDMYMQAGHKAVNLGWSVVQEAIGDGVPSDLTVYDSLGAGINVRLTMVLESKSDTETVYRWFADSPDNQPSEGVSIATGTGTIRFDQHGKMIGASNTTISVERTSVASVSPLSFDFNIDVGALTALATNAPDVSQYYQDGAGAGVLSDYEILSDGTVMGIFSSGVSRPLGQIPLATFTNQEGLLKVGDSLYRASGNSGDAVVNTAGSGKNGVGVIKSRTLELSNADIGTEIINMILASAMYRGNSKVITTSNEMYDALLRIV